MAIPPIAGVRMIVVCSQLKNLSVSCVIYVHRASYNDTFGSQWYTENRHLSTHSILYIPFCRIALLRSGKLVGSISEVVV